MATLIKKSFRLGKIITVNAVNYRCFDSEDFNDFINEILDRYQNRDWGDLSGHDWKNNDLAVLNGMRVLACYQYKDGTDVLITTTWDRKTTYVFLPQERVAVEMSILSGGGF